MNQPLSTQIGSRIRERREILKLTREELAEKAELSFQFLAEIESGKKSMTTNTLAKLVPALGVSADYLLFGSTEKPEPTKIDIMLASLTAREREYAEKLLCVFIEALTK